MWKVLFTIWVIVVTVMSLMPVDPQSLELFPQADKVAHFLFYFGMSFLLGKSLIHRSFRHIITAVGFSAAYGTLMELLQATMGNGRHFDSFDIIANIIGAFAGAALFYFIGSKH